MQISKQDLFIKLRQEIVSCCHENAYSHLMVNDIIRIHHEAIMGS